MSLILSIWTVVVFVLFIGISLWAWSGKNRQDFESAANIPFDEEDDIAANTSEEPGNG